MHFFTFTITVAATRQTVYRLGLVENVVECPAESIRFVHVIYAVISWLIKVGCVVSVENISRPTLRLQIFSACDVIHHQWMSYRSACTLVQRQTYIDVTSAVWVWHSLHTQWRTKLNHDLVLSLSTQITTFFDSNNWRLISLYSAGASTQKKHGCTLRLGKKRGDEDHANFHKSWGED